ncbi:MAG: phosphotransferase, partial [Bdellovibrionales bacterium]|nr:phosphotransferase [Bdellovibrionales bacterium]
MTQFEYRQVGGLRVGLDPQWSRVASADVVNLIVQAPNGSASVLGGRANVTHTELHGVGKVVVKHYHRGGIFGHLVKQTYLRLGPLRSEAEFLLLQQVKSLGVNVPEPVAFVREGAFLYKTWLITREVEGKQSLAQIAQDDEDRVSRYMPEVLRQLKKLIEHRIQHVDLHPGNVLVDGEDQVFLLDFDKARV